MFNEFLIVLMVVLMMNMMMVMMMVTTMMVMVMVVMMTVKDIGSIRRNCSPSIAPHFIFDPKS